MSRPYCPSSGKLKWGEIVKTIQLDSDCTSLLYVKRDNVVDDIVLYVFGQFLLFEPVFVQSGHEVGERPWHSELRFENAPGKNQRLLKRRQRISWQNWHFENQSLPGAWSEWDRTVEWPWLAPIHQTRSQEAAPSRSEGLRSRSEARKVN